MQVGRVVTAFRRKLFAFVQPLHGGPDAFLCRDTYRVAIPGEGLLPIFNTSHDPERLQTLDWPLAEGDWVIYAPTSTPKGPAAEPWTLYTGYMRAAEVWLERQVSSTAYMLFAELLPLIQAADRTPDELLELADEGYDDSYRQGQLSQRNRQIKLALLAGVPAELLALAMGESVESFTALHYLAARFDGCGHQRIVPNLDDPEVLKALRKAVGFDQLLAGSDDRRIPQLPQRFCPTCSQPRVACMPGVRLAVTNLDPPPR